METLQSWCGYATECEIFHKNMTTNYTKELEIAMSVAINSLSGFELHRLHSAFRLKAVGGKLRAGVGGMYK